MNRDGSVRELSPGEQANLSEDFSGGDGGASSWAGCVGREAENRYSGSPADVRASKRRRR